MARVFVVCATGSVGGDVPANARATKRDSSGKAKKNNWKGNWPEGYGCRTRKGN